MSSYLNKLSNMARKELEEIVTKHVSEGVRESDLDDLITEAIAEIADSTVPVYNSDIAQCIVDNTEMLTLEPELGPASGSNWEHAALPIRYVVANLYEYFTNDLSSFYFETLKNKESVGA